MIAATARPRVIAPKALPTPATTATVTTTTPATCVHVTERARRIAAVESAPIGVNADPSATAGALP